MDGAALFGWAWTATPQGRLWETDIAQISLQRAGAQAWAQGRFAKAKPKHPSMTVNHPQTKSDQGQQHQRRPEGNTPNLITPEHKPNPRSSRGHPQGAQHIPGSDGGFMGGSSHQNTLESVTRPGLHCCQPCHYPGDNQTLGMKPIPEVTQK